MLKSRVCFSPKEDQETLMLLCILFYLKAVTVAHAVMVNSFYMYVVVDG